MSRVITYGLAIGLMVTTGCGEQSGSDVASGPTRATEAEAASADDCHSTTTTTDASSDHRLKQERRASGGNVIFEPPGNARAQQRAEEAVGAAHSSDAYGETARQSKVEPEVFFALYTDTAHGTADPQGSIQPRYRRVPVWVVIYPCVTETSAGPERASGLHDVKFVIQDASLEVLSIISEA